VFGPNSPEAQQVVANKDKAFADYVGIAVHCAKGSTLCSTANNGRSDLLPDEPGGYEGFNGLFGHKYVAPQISPDGPLTDLNGAVITNRNTATPYVGFPGFDDMPASTTFGYVAAMLEHGVPVTYAYISDAHDNHTSATAFGPGEAGYVQTLQKYDDAFDKFIKRLAADGIDPSNTLFAFTADEGDHFAGGTPTPDGCDGVTAPCTYSHTVCYVSTGQVCPANQIGEVNVNAAGLLATQKGISTPFRVHSDVAPTFYIRGNPKPEEPVTRTFEQAVGELESFNPYSGRTEKLTQALADPVEMKLLHMITADPTRTPTFTMFAHPDFWLYAGAQSCSSPCVAVQPKFAWNHGTYSPDITTTWLGMVGPGVKAQGDTGAYWSDHADVRPTILSLAGLKDDYASQGRVLFENFTRGSIPDGFRESRSTALELGQVYKQINAPVGELALNSLVISTQAIKGDAGTYSDLSSKLSDITTRRDTLANKIAFVLEAAAFRGASFDSDQARTYIAQARALLAEVRDLASNN
jgi:hypothetical protein